MQKVEVLAGEDGEISVHDHIERRRYGLVAEPPVELREVDTERFIYPIDTAVAFEAERISLPYDAYTAVRNSDGETLVWLQILDEHEFGSGTYFVEIDGAIKLYFRVEGPITVSAEPKERVIELENAGAILLGARSYHERPATTITTTEDPVDLMRAISHLSSALKTTTPDRSYPSLRGHPPELELGNRFEVLSTVTTPDTGVRIEVPPTVESIFPVASLAYYLGAELVPGIEPRIVADGFDHPLESPGIGFERSVERALKRTLFLDCVTRSESSQNPSLHEGRVFGERVSLSFGELFDASPGERLSAYFEVPYESMEPLLPRWKLTAHVKPEAVHASVLPFLVDDLAVIRTPNGNVSAASDAESAAVDAYMRSDGGIPAGSRSEDASRPVVEPGETDSIEQAWVGEETPIGASKAMVEAYRNRVTREPREGDIDVVLVCNDDEMNDELDSVEGTYGSREEVPFNVTTYRHLTPDRLALVLESDIDFLHYVGHIDQDGFECDGGALDAASISDVGVDSFFLNACSSYDQGVELIRRGAIGGAVTLDDVINTGALRVGRTMAGLLNCGFPLRPALDIAREQSIVGSQYIVVGDGNLDIAHAEGLVPELFDLWEHEDDMMWNVDVTTYPTGHANVGSIYKPEVDARDRCFLVGSRDMSFEVPSERLKQTSGMTVMPVRVNGSLMWTDQVDYDA
ncbi:hypothetical protein BRC93_10535 [Halobacteriales archaeon QS_5_70_15]|nr:MAG: hypothetical protein BRC93_10535 [Halobacteriales archaeon QS_5_70_15]